MVADMIGKRFDKLTVIERVGDYISPVNETHHPQYLCKCDCGNTIVVIGRYLRRRKKSSCGCETSLMLYHHKNNVFDLSGEYGVGFTTNTNNKFYFDLEDYELIKDICWWETTNGYITSKSILLHRKIMNPDKNMIIDHINHNKRDNRKCNLRLCTKGENNINKGIKSDNKSGCTGVSYNNEKHKWMASISRDGVDHRLGYFLHLEDAIKARKEAEEIYFNEWGYDKSINQNVIDESC